MRCWRALQSCHAQSVHGFLRAWMGRTPFPLERQAQPRITFFGLLEAFLLAEQFDQSAKGVFIGEVGLPEFEQQARGSFAAARPLFPTRGALPLRVHALPEQVSYPTAPPVCPLAIGRVAQKRPAHTELVGGLPCLQPVFALLFQLASLCDRALHG